MSHKYLEVNGSLPRLFAENIQLTLTSEVATLRFYALEEVQGEEVTWAPVGSVSMTIGHLVRLQETIRGRLEVLQKDFEAAIVPSEEVEK